MSLLKKASIITTPTAYAEDYLYSIKPAYALGSELIPSIVTITNAGGGTITQISGNTYSSTSDGTSGSSIRPKIDFATTSGKTYKLVITPIGAITGTVNFDFYDGSSYIFQNYDFSTVKEIDFTDNGSVFAAFDGTQTYSVANFSISIKEVTDADFDFTRNSTGTRVNEDYLIEDVPYNLATYSEDLSNASWTKTNATVTTDQILAPDGTLTADKVAISSDALSGVRVFTQIDKQKYNFSSFIKKGTTSSVKFYIIQQGVAEYKFDVNLDTGTLGTIPSGITNAKIESAGNDWFRVSCVRDFTAGASNHGVGVVTENGNGGNYYVWGAQLVKGDQPKDYLKTTDRLDIPRIDYTNGEPSILLEPSRTNLFPYSNDYTQSNWTKTNVTITQNAGISPENINNASKMIASSNASFNYIYDSLTGSSSQYTISAFVKADGRNIVWLYTQSVGSNGIIYFDLSDASMQVVAGSSGTPTGTISKMPNGWYRITSTSHTITLSSGSGIGISDAKGSLATTTDGTNGVLIYGLQIEAGSYATSLIHTSGSAVTRSADYVSNSGNSDLISSTEGVLYGELSKPQLDNDAHLLIALINNGATTDQNTVTIGFDSDDDFFIRIKSSGSDILKYNSATSYPNQFYKIAVKYKSGDSSMYIDGKQVASSTNTFTFVNTLNEINFNFDNNNGLPFYGNCKSIMVFKEALTDEELACLTGYNNHELYMNYYNRLSYLGLVEEYNVESDINNYIL